MCAVFARVHVRVQVARCHAHIRDMELARSQRADTLLNLQEQQRERSVLLSAGEEMIALQKQKIGVLEAHIFALEKVRIECAPCQAARSPPDLVVLCPSARHDPHPHPPPLPRRTRPS